MIRKPLCNYVSTAVFSWKTWHFLGDYKLSNGSVDLTHTRWTDRETQRSADYVCEEDSRNRGCAGVLCCVEGRLSKNRCRRTLDPSCPDESVKAFREQRDPKVLLRGLGARPSRPTPLQPHRGTRCSPGPLSSPSGEHIVRVFGPPRVEILEEEEGRTEWE